VNLGSILFVCFICLLVNLTVCLSVCVTICLSVLAKWLARNTPLPLYTEIIFSKSRLKSGFSVYFIVSSFNCVVHRPCVIYFILLWHDIQFKLATLTFKALHTGRPPYLTDLLQHHQSTRSLRSYSSHQLFIPRHNLSLGSRAFPSQLHGSGTNSLSAFAKPSHFLLLTPS